MSLRVSRRVLRRCARGGRVVGVAAPEAGMSLGREGRHYLVVGLLQYGVDWGLMVALSHAGLHVELANIAGRVSGAMLGFWLNGVITFAGAGHRLGRRQFLRFVLMWLLTTFVSTASIGWVNHVAGLKWSWLAKPVIELVLGAVGFLLSRHWIYRR